MDAIRRRLSAILAAAVLAVRLLAPDVGHACDASLAGAAVVAPIEVAADAHAHHHVASTASPSVASASDHVHDVAPVDGTTNPSHECDCDTECCCVATAVAAARSHPRIGAHYASSAHVGFAHHAAWESAWADHVLPFTTAPPSATLS